MSFKDGGIDRSTQQLCTNTDSESGAQMKRQMKPRLSAAHRSGIWKVWRDGVQSGIQGMLKAM